MRILIRGGYLLTLDESDRIIERGDVFIDGSVIAGVGSDLDQAEFQPDRVIEAQGKLVLPGLVNANLYSAENLQRGQVKGNLPETQELISDPAKSAGFADPEWAYVGTMLVAIESVRSGVTTIRDHTPPLRMLSAESVAAIFRAYRDIGLRANLALDASIQNSGEDRSPGEAVLLKTLPSSRDANLVHAEEVHGFLQSAHDNWHDAADGRLRVGVYFSGIDWMDPTIVHWIRSTNSNNQASPVVSILEAGPQTGSTGIKNLATSVTQGLAERGLDLRWMTLFHCNWASRKAIEAIANTDATVVHNPISDLNVGRRPLAIDEFLAAGVPVALGTDFIGGSGNLNMFSVMKMAALLHCISQPDFKRWPRCNTVLGMATDGGALSCGLPDQVGRLETGRKADLTLYDLNSISFTPLNDAKRQLVLCEQGESVDTVIIDGKFVFESGRILTVDEDEILHRARQIPNGFMAGKAEAKSKTEKIEPSGFRKKDRSLRGEKRRPYATIPSQKWIL